MDGFTPEKRSEGEKGGGAQSSDIRRREDLSESRGYAGKLVKNMKEDRVGNTLSKTRRKTALGRRL